MPDAIWIDKEAELAALAKDLETQAWIGVDTEFLRERTFFPKLCLLQIAAADRIWCIDTLRLGSLEPLMSVLTAPLARKVIHAARQDLEAVSCGASWLRCSPRSCRGLRQTKPQVATRNSSRRCWM
jgi:ribonuclease D